MSPEIQRVMLTTLARRGPDKTVCPSEIARALWPDHWRAHLNAVRQVAAELAAQGRLEVTQRGVVVDILSATGPIRLRLVVDRDPRKPATS